jgi:hypothetical protein
MSTFLSGKKFYGERTCANPMLHAPMLQAKNNNFQNIFPELKFPWKTNWKVPPPIFLRVCANRMFGNANFKSQMSDLKCFRSPKEGGAKVIALSS